jgi:hypothetical protein
VITFKNTKTILKKFKMERRGFIKTGLITVTAGASGHLPYGEIMVPLSENITQTEMENFTREMDISMDFISHSAGNYLKHLIPQAPTETEQNYFRSSIRTLLLVGNFGKLPLKGQVHPWMQKRMLYSVPEVNYSVNASLDMLRNMSDETKEEIKSALTEDPDLGGRILETLDLEAKSVGISSSLRRQMRVMGTRITRRLSHSPEMLIHEYIRKADKLLAAANSDEALEHLLKAQAGENNFSNRRNEAENAALYWSSMNIPDISVGYNPIITEQEDIKSSDKKNNLKKRKGMGLLGIGSVLTAAGWLFIGLAVATDGALAAVGAIGVVLGVTVGPILILIALIILIIGAIKSGKAKE